MKYRILINNFVGVLTEKDDCMYANMLEEMIERNHQLGNSDVGFIFGGKTHGQPSKFTAASKRQLHPSLHEDVRDYMENLKVLADNKQRLTQGISLVTRACKTDQDVRDALPDIAASLIPEIRTLSRFKEEAWTIIDKPMQLHSYKMAHDLMMFYFANRIVY